MKTIDARPERVIPANQAMPCAIIVGVATATEIVRATGYDQPFVALVGEFGAIRLANNGEAEADFRSSRLYFPIGHSAAVTQIERPGRLEFAREYIASPCDNPRGYRWSYHNLAKLDRHNLSFLDRVLRPSA